MSALSTGIIDTVPHLCKKCYSCIRECPASAISVINGQAHIMQDRCITCGNCVKVCSQNAKHIRNDALFIIDEVLAKQKSIALVAPSFAASFPETYKKLPTALRAIGFSQVVETAFGADLVSNLYIEDVTSATNHKPIISSSCPAVFNFIRKYKNDLLPNLAGIVSPMIALGKYLRKNNGDDYKLVFIGPCVAKKAEILDDEVKGVIDYVLTFNEIKSIFQLLAIDVGELKDSHFDPPRASTGKSFPLAGGLLKTADLPGDILDKEIIVVEGKQKVIEILDEINNNNINARFIDILFCEGCISGPVIDSSLNYYSRREKVIQFIREDLHQIDKQVWRSDVFNSRELDLRRKFSDLDQRRPMPSEEAINEILAATGKTTRDHELNCGACGYPTCREHAIIIAKGLGEKEMCLPYLIDELQIANESLKSTQEQLQSAEKLASIGQLAAGVAHEINNPLGTIMMYASLLKRQAEKNEQTVGNCADLDLIVKEANRCKSIVSNLLNFARQGKLNAVEVNLDVLIKQIINKVWIDPRYKGIKFDVQLSATEIVVLADKDQIEQVVLNLISNAADAMAEVSEKKISISCTETDSDAFLSVCDSGKGIEKENFGKIFTPFFTTKGMGKGTGLGLAITYGIIKMHKGDINFTSKIGEGTTFKVRLPKNSVNYSQHTTDIFQAS